MRGRLLGQPGPARFRHRGDDARAAWRPRGRLPRRQPHLAADPRKPRRAGLPRHPRPPRRAHPPGRLRWLHRYGRGPGDGKHQPAHHAAQLPRPLGHQGGQGLPVQPRDRRGLGDHRGHHRSAYPRLPLPPVQGARALPPQHRGARPAGRGWPAGRPDQGAQHRLAARVRSAAGGARGTGTDQDRRQRLDRRDHAGGGQGAAAAQQHSRDIEVHLLPARRELLRTGDAVEGRRVLHRRRRQLWPGFEPRTRRPRAALPRRARGTGEELRAHPLAEPVQLRHRAADLRTGRRLRRDPVR
ncbi:hypothetical protein D3C80_1058020 [compost metagenome]